MGVNKKRLEELLHEAESRLADERDRRYAEVNVEKEKALKIKETADLAALQLAREIQTYKDEKANELREQISSERGLYVTKDELASSVDKVSATVAPLSDFVSNAIGRQQGFGVSANVIIGSLVGFSTIIGIIVVLANLLTR